MFLAAKHYRCKLLGCRFFQCKPIDKTNHYGMINTEYNVFDNDSDSDDKDDDIKQRSVQYSYSVFTKKPKETGSVDNLKESKAGPNRTSILKETHLPKETSEPPDISLSIFPQNQKLAKPTPTSVPDYLSLDLHATINIEPRNKPNQSTNMDESILNQHSIGLQLMKKMGFEPSVLLTSSLVSTLAPSKQLAEPIKIKVKNNRLGIGADQTFCSSSIHSDTNVEQYRIRRQYKYEAQQIKHTIRILQRKCFNMSGESDQVAKGMPLEKVHLLWREEAAKQVNALSHTSGVLNRNVLSENVDLTMDDDKKIVSLLTYLQHIHNFCYYCGDKYTSAYDLAVNCPGLMESDH